MKDGIGYGIGTEHLDRYEYLITLPSGYLVKRLLETEADYDNLWRRVHYVLDLANSEHCSESGVVRKLKEIMS